jgi:hypothetical protein
MRDLMNQIETLWCEQMHTAVMWPIHGKYRCGTCMREYAVGFETVERPPLEHRGSAPIAASI